MKKVFIMFIMLLFVAVSAFAAMPEDLIGKKFIDVYGKDEKGKIVKLSDVAGKGKPVVVVYWAIGDVDIYKVLPEINKIGKKYKDKIILIAPLLSVSDDKEVKEAKKLLHFEFPVWLAVPYIVFIDKDGTIKNIMVTARDLKKIEENIKNLIK
jgi:peroxiredoxin